MSVICSALILVHHGIMLIAAPLPYSKVSQATMSKTHTIPPDQLIQVAKQALADEAHEVTQLQQLIDQRFIQACEIILNSQGHTIVLGMGKSGHIGGKIAATLASTGTPAFFVHPAEASHGDLGMITAQDTCLLLSYSGETHELVSIIPALKRLGTPIIAITGNSDSSLAQHADISLSLNIHKEACPLNLAPTSSSTATLALGDALAIALLHARGFNQTHFAQTHPGGKLGKQLLLTVADLMHRDAEIPQVPDQASLADALIEISRKGLGVSCVVDAQQRLQGIFTDGDVRRSLTQAHLDTQSSITEHMSTQTITVKPDILAVDALALMQQHKITVLAVTDTHEKLLGVLHMHDILRAKII